VEVGQYRKVSIGVGLNHFILFGGNSVVVGQSCLARWLNIGRGGGSQKGQSLSPLSSLLPLLTYVYFTLFCSLWLCTSMLVRF